MSAQLSCCVFIIILCTVKYENLVGVKFENMVGFKWTLLVKCCPAFWYGLIF